MSRTLRAALPAIFMTASALMSQPAWRPKAQALVNQGITYLQEHGKEAFLAEVNKANGRFHARPENSLYLFVFDEQGNSLAHGFQSNLVNINRWNHKDPDGKLFIQGIIAAGQTKGGAWANYRYENPVNHQVEAKTSFCMAKDGIIVGCGIYK